MHFAFFLILFFLPDIAAAQPVCDIVAGAKIVAQDGKYLGQIASEYDSESVLNKYGTFGSSYSSDSIWNEYGNYGGEYAANSPFNPYSSKPPLIIKNGKVIGYLTVNRIITSSLNPFVLKTCKF
jgi:hypothetical protein